MKKIKMRKLGKTVVGLGVYFLMILITAKPVYADTYEYDDLNRLIRVEYDDGSYTTYDYDANGNMKSETNYVTEKQPDMGNEDDSDIQTPDITQKEEINESDKELNKEPDKEPDSESVKEEKHKDGMKAKNKEAEYTIISVKKRTASFDKYLNKKKTSYSVPNEIKIDGKKYKVVKISNKAFKSNNKLKKVTIGKNVKSIGKQCFYGCEKLKTITVKSTKLKSVGKNAFKGIHKKAKIKVPKKKYSKYLKLLKNKGQKKSVKIKKN